MSARYEWLAAPQIEVGGSARPDYVVGSDGEGNAAACITLFNRHTGDGAVLEGRPEHLLEKAREILRVAEQIVEVTMRDPNLRSLYGITTKIEVAMPSEYMPHIERLRAAGKTDSEIVLDAISKVMSQVGTEEPEFKPRYRVQNNVTGATSSAEWVEQAYANSACASLNGYHSGGLYGVYRSTPDGKWERDLS